MINKIAILILTTLLMAGNAGAEDRLTLDTPLLCTAKHFAGFRYSKDYSKIEVADANETDVQYLISVNGVKVFKRSYHSTDSCEVAGAFIMCNGLERRDIHTFTIHAISGMFWTTGGSQDDQGRTYQLIETGSCVIDPHGILHH